MLQNNRDQVRRTQQCYLTIYRKRGAGDTGIDLSAFNAPSVVDIPTEFTHPTLYPVNVFKILSLRVCSCVSSLVITLYLASRSKSPAYVRRRSLWQVVVSKWSEEYPGLCEESITFSGRQSVAAILNCPVHATLRSRWRFGGWRQVLWLVLQLNTSQERTR